LWVIAGLGNPGWRYRKTRHNVGFAVVDSLAKQFSLRFDKEKIYACCKGLYKDERFVLIKPLTYMNSSGLAVRKALKLYDASPGKLIVVHDDIDLPVGKIKIKKKGSSGGHRGIQSIIDQIGTEEYIHIKIGIGRSPGVPSEVYVLEKFRKEEKKIIMESLQIAPRAVLDAMEKGVDWAMNNYN
jgi:PTH1 family peptidyl-tRNA hydrolase